MSDTPHLVVLPEGTQFKICDQDGNAYGTYDTQDEADVARENWSAYYEAP